MCQKSDIAFMSRPTSMLGLTDVRPRLFQWFLSALPASPLPLSETRFMQTVFYLYSVVFFYYKAEGASAFALSTTIRTGWSSNRRFASVCKTNLKYEDGFCL